MIKNYNMVREAELNYQSTHKLSLEERFKVMDEMFLFARKFEREIVYPENTPHMLIGGYAMVIHGFPRLTQDLDISLGIDTEHIDKVLEAVKKDFKTLVKDPIAFARDTNVLLLQDIETGIRIDLVFTFIEFERKAIAEADEIN